MDPMAQGRFRSPRDARANGPALTPTTWPGVTPCLPAVSRARRDVVSDGRAGAGPPGRSPPRAPAATIALLVGNGRWTAGRLSWRGLRPFRRFLRPPGTAPG